MTISRIGKCFSVITSVLASAFLTLLAVCCFHRVGAGAKGVAVAGQIGEYLKYLTLPLLLTVFFLALWVVIRLAERKNKRRKIRNNKEILSVYEAVYKIRTLEGEKDKKFHRIIKARNLVDLIACQTSLLCFIFALDYLIFFSGFAYESVGSDVNKALTVIMPLWAVGVIILIARWLISEGQSAAALKLVEGDKRAKKVISTLKKSEVTEGFFRFKARVNGIGLVKALMIGLGVGSAVGGAAWILAKRCIVSLDNLLCILIGAGCGLVVFGVLFLIGRKNNIDIARQLDRELDLKARVQTMVEFSDDDGELPTLQRLDTERALSEISTRSYKFKKLWAYLLVALIGLALIGGGFLVADMRDYVPPEQIEPFELSELQEAGLLELINYVENSALEEEFKRPMVGELNSLLTELRKIKTMPEMQATLIKSMAVLTEITYDSSTAAELLNAMWDTEDLYLRYLAVVLDTSSWTSPDWGDFAEKTDEYIGILMGDGDETPGATLGAQRVKAAIDGMARKLDILLSASGLPEDDEMYMALYNLFNNDLVGLSKIVGVADYMSDDEIRELLKTNLNIMSEDTFAAISLNRSNAIVGEYTMTRLSGLFGVSAPQFERPEFVKNGETPDGNQGSGAGKEDDDQENTGSDGGIGEGETFGSDDLVLDPITGKYVKFGELLQQKYYAIMYERLQGDFYTEEQKEAIMKYFEMLYSGVKKEEGK